MGETVAVRCERSEPFAGPERGGLKHWFTPGVNAVSREYLEACQDVSFIQGMFRSGELSVVEKAPAAPRPQPAAEEADPAPARSAKKKTTSRRGGR